MVALSLSLFPSPAPRDGMTIFIAFALPYILVVILAYVGARIVYSLGAEVSRARELGSTMNDAKPGQGGIREVQPTPREAEADQRLSTRTARALSLGAVAFGAFALGATAIGALASGQLAVGAFAVKRGRVRALSVDNLEVRHLRIRELTLDNGVPR
jgi:hypothetical protein